MLVGAQYQGDHRGPKAFARRAEAAGFDSVWCGDHIGHLVDGIAALGILAGATERVTIGVNVLVVPHRAAVVLAKGVATVAQVAPGRVVAGVGVGGEFPEELAAAGAELRTRGADTDEALQVAQRLWAGERVTHHGRRAAVEGLQLEPVPEPPPALWVGGRSEAALRRAVRFGSGYIPYLVSPDQLARRRSRLHELAAEAGRGPGELALASLVTLVPAPTVDAALERAMTSLRLSGITPGSVRASYLLGPDDAVLGQLQAYADAGLDHLVLGCPPGDDAQLDAFFAAAARLLPAARALRPRPAAGA